MTWRRALPLLVLIALTLSPFSRMNMAEAAATPHQATPVAGHCTDMPAPEPGKPGKAIDCMIACSAVAPAGAPELAPFPPLAAAPTVLPLFAFAGIVPEAEPPPPRIS